MTSIIGSVNIGYLSRYNAFLWWRHHTDFFLCYWPPEGNLPVTAGFSWQRADNAGFVFFFNINLNKWFNKQPMLPLAMALMWRHCNNNAVYNLSHKSRNYLFSWLCCQWESVDVYFSWPENTLEQTADRAVILDPLLLSYFWQNCVEVIS